jgi:serine/threonine protein kinase
VYSVGAILYEMLANRRPLHRGSAAPSVSNMRVHPEVDDIVLKAVAPNPNSRHQSAALLAAELRSVVAAIDARGVGGDEDGHVEASRPRTARVLTLTAVTLLTLGALAWWFAAR